MSELKELVKEVSEDIASAYSDSSNEDFLYLSNKIRHESLSLSKQNFKHLEHFVTQKSMYFFDGGSQEIISSNSLSLYHIRIAACKYNGFRLSKKYVEDYFVYSKFSKLDDKLRIVSKVYSFDNKASSSEFFFDMDDETLREGLSSVSIKKIGGVIRRLFEIRFARKLIDEMEKGDCIFLDGSLQAMVTYEKSYIDSLLFKAEANDVLVCALAKTSAFVTNTGISLKSALDNFVVGTELEKSKWFYHPLVDINDENYVADLSVVKLHNRAKHYFILETNKRQKYVHREKVIGYLAMLSTDPVFRGYPYPLIKVDELARVTNDDARFIRMRFAKELDIEGLELDSNAHSVLDSIKF